MASVRERKRKDGSTYYDVRYRLDGRDCAVSVETKGRAEDVRALFNSAGPARALEILGIQRVKREPGELTLSEWLDRHIASLTGVEKKTVEEYVRYAHRDIGPTLGSTPLSVLTSDQVAGWIKAMRDAGSSGKTIANKHGFLSSALNAAVERGLMPANPSRGQRIPRTERRGMIALTPEEFQILRANFTDHYRPLVDFLVASGCRFSEAAALRPSDVNREEGTVWITRAWKHIPKSGRSTKDGWELGPPKTQKSRRMIDVDNSVLDALDYSGEYLFANKAGNPVRVYGFRENVWNKSVQRAMEKGLDGALLKRRPRIHDLRHTCATWMILDGNPLPVVQQHLGHESIDTTIAVYGHLNREATKRAAGSIAKAMTYNATSTPRENAES